MSEQEIERGIELTAQEVWDQDRDLIKILKLENKKLHQMYDLSQRINDKQREYVNILNQKILELEKGIKQTTR